MTRENQVDEVIKARAVLALWGAKFEKYHTTADYCRCPDFQIRGLCRHEGPCKHILALRRLKEAKHEAEI